MGEIVDIEDYRPTPDGWVTLRGWPEEPSKVHVFPAKMLDNMVDGVTDWRLLDDDVIRRILKDWRENVIGPRP